MKTRLGRMSFAIGALCLFAASPTLVRAQNANLTKEVMAKKGGINWKNAPANAISSDVCNMLQVCGGTTKVIALSPTTEGAARVVRGLFLTQDQKHADVVVLEHDDAGVDRYFFLLNGDGNLAKAAYASSSSTSWQAIGSVVAGPTFQKDLAVWQKEIAKLNANPAAAAPAADKKDAAQ